MKYFINQTAGRYSLFLLCASCAFLGAAFNASAANYYAAGNGDWTNAVTWIGSVVPGSGDTGIITNNYTVTLTNQENITSAVNIGTTTFNHKGGTVVLSNATLNATLDSYVGKGTTGARGTLLIAGGGTFNQGGSSKSFYIQGTGTGPRTGSEVTVDNGTLSLSYHFSLDGVGGVLVVTNGGLVTQAVADISISATNNLIYIGGTNAAGTPASMVAGRYIHVQSASNGIIVDQGGSFSNINSTYGLALGGNSATPASGIGSSGNFLIVTNGGYASFLNHVNVGYNAATNNYVHVGGAGINGTPATIMIGNNRSLYVGGSQSNNVGNYVWVGQGGQVTNVTTLYVGGSATGTNINNYVSLASGGLMEIKTGITVGNATEVGNRVLNNGGILQFTKYNPAITINNKNSDLGLGNDIVMDSGTLAYSGVQSGVLPNLTNNWGMTDVGAFTWLGTNTFRLNNCYATNSLAQGYTFVNNLGGTNYAGLELVNGVTMIRGKGVTIGDGTVGHGGSLLVSNTTATFAGVLTNYSANVNLACVAGLVASKGIVWMNNSAATTTAGQVTFDASTTNYLDSGIVTWHQSAATATQTVNGVVMGNGGLVKGGPGVLILAASNTYTGATTVSNGVLSLSLSNSLYTNAVVYIAGGAALDLNFSGTNTIQSLYVNGSPMYGVCNAANVSGYLTGSGNLKILSIASSEGSIFLIF